MRFAFRIGDHPAAFQVHSLRRFIPASSVMSQLTFKNLVRASGLYVGRAFPEVRCRQTQAVIPGPQIHDSWALPQWGRVRFNTANRGLHVSAACTRAPSIARKRREERVHTLRPGVALDACAIVAPSGPARGLVAEAGNAHS